MDIRLVAFDLDGTLMDAEGQISPRVRRAVSAAQEQGVVVTVVTGRMFVETVPRVQDLNIAAPLLGYQGGWIQVAGEEEPLYRASLPIDVAREALGLADARGWHTVLYADQRIFTREMRHPPEFYRRWLGLEHHVVDGWQGVLERHTLDKVLFVAEPDAIPAMAELLKARMGDCAQIFRSHAQFVEVVPKGVDKATGLAWLAEHLEIPREAVMAVGDQENDLPMVEWAGLGVAMGNAVEPVREVADWVAPPVQEDGAAVALERFVLDRGAA
jgi:hypothetical protein